MSERLLTTLLMSRVSQPTVTNNVMFTCHTGCSSTTTIHHPRLFSQPHSTSLCQQNDNNFNHHVGSMQRQYGGTTNGCQRNATSTLGLGDGVRARRGVTRRPTRATAAQATRGRIPQRCVACPHRLPTAH